MDYEKLPSNSNKHRAEQQEENKKVIEKLKPVGEVKIHEKNVLERLTSSFIEEDLTHVKGYVWANVLKPAIKDAIVNTVNGAMEMFFYGSSTPRTKRNKVSRPNEVTSYSSYYMSEKRSATPGPSADSIDFRCYAFKDPKDAEKLILILLETIERYNQVSVNNYYSILEGILKDDEGNSISIPSSWTDEKYGWTDLTGIKKRWTRDGWIVDLPRAEVLE